MSRREDEVPVLRATDLWKEYGEAGAALRGASLSITAGSLVALYGKSGSGKTTLLNLLAGLDRPTRGRVEVQGEDLETLGERGRTLLRRARLGFVFQFFNLLPTLTAFENVFLSLELAGRPDGRAARAALANLGLAGKEGRFPNELSGGEQQRVAIARALVKDPALILADEPTGNLDTRTGDEVLNILVRLCREQGTTLLVATHSPRVSAVVDRVLCMTDGVIEEGTPCGEPQTASLSSPQ